MVGLGEQGRNNLARHRQVAGPKQSSTWLKQAEELRWRAQTQFSDAARPFGSHQLQASLASAVPAEPSSGNSD